MPEIRSDAIGMAALERRISSARVARVRAISRAASATVSALGILMLAASVFVSPTPDAASLFPPRVSTALALALFGVSTWALAGEGPRSRWLAVSAASLVAVGAAARLAGYLWGIEPVVDRAFVGRIGDPTLVERLSPATLASAVLLSLGIIVMDRSGRAGWVGRLGEGLLMAGGAIGALGCLGYVLGIEHLRSIAGFASVSLPTTAALTLTSGAALLARPTQGLSRVLVAESAGGDSARRLLPLVLLAPFISTLVARLGGDLGLYDFEVQVVVMGLLSAAFLAAVVWSGASALERSERLRRIAEGAAGVDTLTGLGTRRHLEFELAALHAASVPPSYSVISIDVDGLKQLNDDRGHTAGDEALRDLAEAIRRVVRPGDVVARIGGDEFVVVLPGASEEDAAHVLTRLRRAVSEPGSGDAPRLAASLGLAVLERGEPPKVVLARADAAMYEHKARRDRRRISGGKPASQ